MTGAGDQGATCHLIAAGLPRCLSKDEEVGEGSGTHSDAWPQLSVYSLGPRGELSPYAFIEESEASNILSEHRGLLIGTSVLCGS